MLRAAVLALAGFALFTVPAVAQSRPGAEAAAIAEIAGKRAVKTALAAIEADTRRANAQMVTLNEIPAPPFGEGPRAQRFAEMLREAGIADVSLDATGNVIGRRPGVGGGPVVALIAHIDTVFPIETDVRVRIEGDTYRAPGIGDNSRGLAYLLTLARAMTAAELRTRGDVLFIGSVGEEGLGDLRGVRALFAEGGPKIDVALAIDGGAPGRLVNVAVGSIRYRAMITGPGGHSYGAFGLANPHHAMGRLIADFDAAAAPLTVGEPKATYNVGRIGGGASVNAIPGESWAEIDMRSHDPARLQALDAALRAAAEAAVAAENAERVLGEPLVLRLEPVGNRPAGGMSEDAPLARAAVAAMARFGVSPEFTASSTDANIPLSLGIPALTLSRGGISTGAHALDEAWQDVDTHIAVQIGLLITLSQAGLAR